MTCQHIKHDLFVPEITWECGAEADYFALVDGYWMCFECAGQHKDRKPELALSSHILGLLTRTQRRKKIA